MDLPRSSGILFHPTSLPGPYGVGDLGPEAEAFGQLLAEAGQRWWQMLPITPGGSGYSPYSGSSSLAGNPLLISPDALVRDGWLSRSELEGLPEFPPDRADFDAASRLKDRLLRRAFERFESALGPRYSLVAFEEFCEAEAPWLDDFALFEAIRESVGGLPHPQWPDRDLARREPAALKRTRARLADAVRYRKFVQYVFDHQWRALRDRLHNRGISLIGDLPIFVSADSADVWTHPELFHVDEDGRPTLVAGVPPDLFQEDGQYWGNPLYFWDEHMADDFAWWVARIRGTLRRFSLLRIDHFRGFAACYTIPADATTAADPRCRWEPAPGLDLFSSLAKYLGPQLPLIAEDLGVITAGVERLRDSFELPGMRVLQFGFGDDPLADYYLPHSYIHRAIAYTGTHDNDTTLGWLTAPPGGTTQTPEQIAAERSFVHRYLGLPANSPPELAVLGLLRSAWSSVAATAIAPLQDWLLLGSEARMNVPGVAEGNWTWRVPAGLLNPQSLHQLAEATATTGRWNGPIPLSLRTRLGAPMLQSRSSPRPPA